MPATSERTFIISTALKQTLLPHPPRRRYETAAGGGEFERISVKEIVNILFFELAECFDHHAMILVFVYLTNRQQHNRIIRNPQFSSDCRSLYALCFRIYCKFLRVNTDTRHIIDLLRRELLSASIVFLVDCDQRILSQTAQCRSRVSALMTKPSTTGL